MTNTANQSPNALDSPSARYLNILLLALPCLAAFSWIGESESNSYGVSQYFITYRHGFIKRGLIGQLLTPLGYLSAGKIHAIEILFVCAAVLLSYLVFWPAFRSSTLSRLGALLFLCSPACLPHLSELAGQPDIVLYLLLLLAFAMLTRLPGSWAPLCATLPCVVALLVHEGFLLLFYPVVAAILLDGYRRRRYPRISVLAHVAVFLAAFFLIIRLGVSRVPPAALLAEAQARTDTVVNPTVFSTLAFTFQQQWHYLATVYTARVIAGVLFSSVVLSPYIAGTVGLLLKVNESRETPMPRKTLLLMFATPLLLCFLGHDVLRWLAGAEICALLFLVYIPGERKDLPSDRATQPHSSLWYALLLYGLAVGPMGGTSIRLLARAVVMISKGTSAP